MCSDIYSGSYKINSLGPKRLLETQFFRTKGKLSKEEKLLAYFFSYFNHDKPQGTQCKGPKCNLENTVEAIRSFVYNLRGCWKLKFLEKRQSFQRKKY